MMNNQQKTDNSLLNYDYTVSCISKNEYILSYKEKYYKIGEFVYQILLEGKKANSLEDLVICLGNNAIITVASLKEIIDTKILPVFKSPETALKEQTGGFWMKRQILSSKNTAVLARPISFLFGSLFYPLFLILLFFNVWLYYKTSDSISNSSISQAYEILAWFVSYLSLFIIMFVHELGHAASAIKSGIKPRSIGLGFYTIMPAMYTDLTDIWRLSSNKKVKINLSGIFIQLIINILIVSIINLTDEDLVQSIASKIYFVNSLLIILNLVPFLKFDGYWILSDFFGIPNLIPQSDKMLMDAVTIKDPFDEEDNIKKTPLKQTVLTIYTVLRVLFIATTIFFVFAFIYSSFLKSIILIKYLPYLKLNFATTIEISKRIATIAVIVLFTRKYKKIFFNIILKKARWYKV